VNFVALVQCANYLCDATSWTRDGRVVVGEVLRVRRFAKRRGEGDTGTSSGRSVVGEVLRVRRFVVPTDIPGDEFPHRSGIGRHQEISNSHISSCIFFRIFYFCKKVGVLVNKSHISFSLFLGQ